MSRRLTVRVADLFAAEPDAVQDAVRRMLPPRVSGHVVGTGAGTVVTLETVLQAALPGLGIGRRKRAVVDLDAVLTAVHHELDTAVAAPKSG